MKAEEILEKHYKKYEKRITYPEQVIAAMEEYAQQQVSLISKTPTVIKSVCVCGSEKPYKRSKYEEGYEYCTNCFRSRLIK